MQSSHQNARKYLLLILFIYSVVNYMLSTETILSNVFNGPTTSPDRNHDATTSGATTTTSIHSTATTMQVTKKNRRRDRSSDDDSTTAAAAAADGTDTLSSHTSNTITSKKANIRNEKDHHHNDDLLVAPIIIGAGQGTTGTHFFAEVTCHLGYTSIHYHAGCIPNHNHKDKDKDKNNPPPESTKYSSLSTNNKQNISFSSASPEATVVPKNYKNLQYNQRCLIKQFRALWSSFLPPALYRNQTLDLLEGIIVFGKENGVFLALYDTPYPFLVPQIIKLVRKHYHGRRPILLLSEREPFSYAKRRVEMHGHDHMMCKNTSTTTTTIDPVTLEGGAFDIIGCIEKALDGISEEQANQLVVGDLFESMNQAYEVKGAAYVAKEVEMYQNAVRGLADFSFDMFARKEKTQVKDLASRMQSKLDSMDVLVKDKGQFDVCTAEHDCVMDIVNYAKNFNVPGMIYNQERFKEQCTRKNGVRKTGGPTNQTAIVKLSSGAINPCAQVCEMISFN